MRISGGGQLLKAFCRAFYDSLNLLNPDTTVFRSIGHGEKAIRHEGNEAIGNSCHPELVSGSVEKMLNQVQHDNKINSSLMRERLASKGRERSGVLFNASRSREVRWMPSRRGKCAFTLAEVLITLGIVGVVAALTIPGLMTKINERVTVQKLTSVYAKMNQAFKMMIEEVGELDQYDSDERNGLMIDIFPKYVKIVRQCAGRQLPFCFPEQEYTIDGVEISHYGFGWSSMELFDGSMITYAMFDNCNEDISFSRNPDNKNYGSYHHTCGEIYVDINGKSKPNTHGKDIFAFYIMTNGIIPAGSKKETVWARSFSGYCINNSDNTKLNGGSGCSAWVIENKNMDYLHCPEKLGWNKAKSCKN